LTGNWLVMSTEPFPSRSSMISSNSRYGLAPVVNGGAKVVERWRFESPWVAV
jgi:hypothetical protein